MDLIASFSAHTYYSGQKVLDFDTVWAMFAANH